MVKSIDLANVLVLAASGAYGGQRVLSANSEAALLCAGILLADLDNWQGASTDLTQSEIDVIEAIVAGIEADAMTEDGEDMGDYIQIAESVAIEDVGELVIDDFDEGTYHTYKLIIQGLKTDYDENYADHLGVEFNDDDTPANYSCWNRFESLTNYIRAEYLGTSDFFQAAWFCSTTYGTAYAIGHAEFTLYDPQGDDYKTLVGESFINNNVADQLIGNALRGTYLDMAEITEIRVFPVLGDLFKIDPANPAFPSELRMMLYGLK